MTGRKPTTIDVYLAPLDAEKRAALQKLRKAIRAAAPRAEECIAYGIPTFRIGGRMLLSLGAAKNHCALYAGTAIVRDHAKALAAYDTSNGTIRFAPDARLPATLVRKLVKARVAERVTDR